MDCWLLRLRIRKVLLGVAANPIILFVELESYLSVLVALST